MRRYWRLTKLLFKTSLIRDMQFRGAFFADMISVLLWTFSYVFIVEVLYAHTDTLYGWSRGNLILLLGIWVLIDDLLGATVWKGLMELPKAVAEGKLDFALTKPVDSQFLLATQRFYLVRFFTAIIGVGITAYGIAIGGIGRDPLNLLAFPLLLACGYLLAFCIFMLLQTLGFWFLRVENIWALFDAIESVAKYPLDVFGRPMKLITMTVIPLFVAYLFPAQALLGRLSILEILYAPALTIVFLWLTRRFYQYSVRRYSSVA